MSDRRFRHNAHSQLLLAHLPYRTLDVHDRRGAQKALLAAIGLLRDCSMKADNGGHGHHMGGVLGHMVAHDAANLAMGVFGIYVVQLPFSGDLAGRGGARDTALAKGKDFKSAVQSAHRTRCCGGR